MALLGLVGGWWAAYGIEEWFIKRSSLVGAESVSLAVRVQVVSRPEYEVTAEGLEQVVRNVIRRRAPWVVVDSAARHRVELSVELKPMEGNPDGYNGWVRASFHRSRWVPWFVRRPPEWSQKILVFGEPPRLGSHPRDNVRGAVRIISENFVTIVLLPR